MNKQENSRIPIRERIKSRVNVVFEAADRKLDQAALSVYNLSDKASRIRIIIKPSEQEEGDRRLEKFHALQPYMDKILLHDIETVLDIDTFPMVDKYGNEYPSLRQTRLEGEKRKQQVDKFLEKIKDESEK